MASRKLYFILIVLVCLIALLLNQSSLFEVFKEYESRVVGYSECISLSSDAIGAEDAVRLSTNPSLAILSAAPHKSLNTDSIEEGNMYLLDLDNSEVSVIPREGFSGIFHPHGVSIYQTEDNRTFLYIVNHQNLGMPDQVLIFEFKNEKLYHVKTIEDDKFVSLNGIIASGEHSFYVSNDVGYKRDDWKKFASLLFSALSNASVVYWDGSSSHFAIPPGILSFANGVGISIDKNYFYAGDSNEKSFNIFSIDSKDPSKFEFINKILVNTGIDNIDVNPEDGSITAGCHINSFRFLQHVSNPNEKTAPSQVIRIVLDEENNASIEEIYLNNGDEISASASGLVIGDYLLITPLLEDSIVICKK